MKRNHSIRLVRVITVPITIKSILAGQFRYMIQRGFEVYAVSADGPEVSQIIEQETCAHRVIPFTRHITPFTDLVCLAKLVLLFLKLRPEIVHSQTPKAGLLGMMAAWITRVPVRIHSVVGLPMMEARGLRRIVLRESERVIYFCARRVYTNSLGLEKYLLGMFRFPNGKLRVIGNGSSNGLDTTKFSRNEQSRERARVIRQHAGIADTDFVFCFVGRLVKDKGIHELVEAFQLLEKKERPFWLILLGQFEDDIDPLRPEVRSVIASHNRILAPGFSPEVRDYMAASDAFVFPSYREGFPNVVLQACAMELPSIVTNINGSTEIISHMENGLVVNVKDANALREAMELMATDDTLRRNLASRTRERVMEKFEQSEFWKSLEVEYHSLIRDYVSPGN